MNKLLFALPLGGALLCTSCISEEALNAECDIESCRVEMDDPASVFYVASDTVRRVFSVDTVVTFSIREDADRERLKSLPLWLKLTPGATVQPANGSVQDFSAGDVRYTVTSEDGQWHRDYHVRFLPMPILNPVFDFEDVELEPARGKYYNWFAYGSGHVRQNLWATGNSGFALSRSSARPMEYPTVPWDDALAGKSVKLETCNTGGFGAMVNMRIAAGNLFLGTFDTQNALKDAMAATCFGVPVNRKPVRFKGAYKFMPGQTFQDEKGVAVEGRVDAPDAYAVLYRNTDKNGQPFVLHGDDVLTSPAIVAMARVENFFHTGVEADSPWKYFDLPLVYNEPVDMSLLRNFGYNLAVVFTSSVEGASFRGAVGSTFIVDSAEVVYEEEDASF